MDADDYLRKAAEAEERAANGRDIEIKRDWMEIARQWRVIARQRQPTTMARPGKL